MKFEDFPPFKVYDQDYSKDPLKPLIKFCCNETRKYLDLCILYYGDEHKFCLKWRKQHYTCMDQYGYNLRKYGLDDHIDNIDMDG